MGFNRTRDFFKVKLSEERMAKKGEEQEPDNRAHVSMFSEFFSDASEVPMYTNGMFEGLKNDIMSSIELNRTREPITMMIYEAKQSDELTREFALVGFKKYISLCVKKKSNYVINQIVVFSMFLVLGVLCIYFSNVLNPGVIRPWIANCLNNVGCVFLWNFVGYFAFQFNGDKRELQRLKQIRDMDFVFRRWE